MKELEKIFDKEVMEDYYLVGSISKPSIVLILRGGKERILELN